ncbi:hypothetical protein SAMN05518672_10434 [Chitinophaga sp. CF118]|nr:hypothetical protein SAMN05518672_10434 [Chitinophaga sp. CF118]
MGTVTITLLNPKDRNLKSRNKNIPAVFKPTTVTYKT